MKIILENGQSRKYQKIFARNYHNSVKILQIFFPSGSENANNEACISFFFKQLNILDWNK